jgi:hypothetical protein
MNREDDPALYDWVKEAAEQAVMRGQGRFIRAMCQAALLADYQNYMILRPALLQLRAKCPVDTLQTGEGWLPPVRDIGNRAVFHEIIPPKSE